eukprot:8818816-Pyramimonas_sp.AAC.1
MSNSFDHDEYLTFNDSDFVTTESSSPWSTYLCTTTYKEAACASMCTTSSSRRASLGVPGLSYSLVQGGGQQVTSYRLGGGSVPRSVPRPPQCKRRCGLGV